MKLKVFSFQFYEVNKSIKVLENTKLISKTNDNYLYQLNSCQNEIRRDIKVCIQNVNGTRLGLFTPDFAFEEITRNKLKLLLVLYCIDILINSKYV